MVAPSRAFVLLAGGHRGSELIGAEHTQILAQPAPRRHQPVRARADQAERLDLALAELGPPHARVSDAQHAAVVHSVQDQRQRPDVTRLGEPDRDVLPLDARHRLGRKRALQLGERAREVGPQPLVRAALEHTRRHHQRLRLLGRHGQRPQLGAARQRVAIARRTHDGEAGLL
jgi:hypothetical protein